MTELLCVPFKQTLAIDLQKELSNLIDSTTYQTSSFFADDISKISALREKACDSEVSETKLDNLKQYLNCLTDLKEKFPDNRIKFTWFQTLSQKSYTSSQYSIEFEKLNVLYNVAAVYSLLAMNANDGSLLALKKLCSYFQLSAGCFQYIVDHLQDTKEPVFDKFTGLTLVSMMLAQAQECFWFKAVQDDHKDSLISRLAEQTSQLYDEAFLYSKKSHLVRSDWNNHLKQKSAHFKAVALYRNALALGQNGNHGAMVRSLRMALEAIKNSNLPSRNEFVPKIEDALKNTERDNDFIYLQPVPSHIPPIKPALMVKPPSIEGVLNDERSSDDKLFKALVPIHVIESCSAYSERQQAYVEEHVVRPLKALNKLLVDQLPKYELPSNLKTASKEELLHVELSLQDQRQNNSRIKGLLEEIRYCLEKESKTYDNLSARYGSINWTLPESSKLNSAFYEKLESLQKYLKQGQSVDDETTALFRSIDQDLITSDIKLPESNSAIVKECNQVIAERNDYSAKVLLKSSEYRILPKVISEYRKSGESDFEGLFREHLKHFDIDLAYVKEQSIKNQILSEKIQAEDSSKTVKRLESREIYIEDLRFSLQSLEDVKENIEEGANFYQTLMQSGHALLTEVEQFEASRTEQGRELEKRLTAKRSDQ
ncbi:hypothetical protein HG536_0D01810 [Torulaspora globosa]|uniref:BRO1 domain-containing protein n=1 Tax=Torulaspora globosa TaxID=48254 RepID=A0A7G3ZGM3_9SACH|nr:uncharacterized protein HG536_0D01810 [Torulaspora globosa]QLL32659.1 hypothetical protein HG536_0D01810 [Torulaspora globosa]